MKRESRYRLRLLLIQRRNLKRSFLNIENRIRHSLKVLGLRFDRVGGGTSRGGSARSAMAMFGARCTRPTVMLKWFKSKDAIKSWGLPGAAAITRGRAWSLLRETRVRPSGVLAAYTIRQRWHVLGHS
jgi:hypothetical protein